MNQETLMTTLPKAPTAGTRRSLGVIGCLFGNSFMRREQFPKLYGRWLERWKGD
jgi:hypothetical protein